MSDCSRDMSDCSQDTLSIRDRFQAELLVRPSTEAVSLDGKSPGISQEELDYIEMRALVETQREAIGNLGTIPF